MPIIILSMISRVPASPGLKTQLNIRHHPAQQLHQLAIKLLTISANTHTSRQRLAMLRHKCQPLLVLFPPHPSCKAVQHSFLLFCQKMHHITKSLLVHFDADKMLFLCCSTAFLIKLSRLVNPACSIALPRSISSVSVKCVVMLVIVWCAGIARPARG